VRGQLGVYIVGGENFSTNQIARNLIGRWKICADYKRSAFPPDFDMNQTVSILRETWIQDINDLYKRYPVLGTSTVKGLVHGTSTAVWKTATSRTNDENCPVMDKKDEEDVQSWIRRPAKLSRPEHADHRLKNCFERHPRYWARHGISVSVPGCRECGEDCRLLRISGRRGLSRKGSRWAFWSFLLI
jgi:hypothetical protein